MEPVDWEATRTSWSSDPVITWDIVADSHADVVFTYPNRLRVAGSPQRFVMVRFRHVQLFRFTAQGFHRFGDDTPPILVFELGVAVDTPLKERFLQQSTWSRTGGVGRLGLYASEDELLHYTIAFDELGWFDVLCFGHEISEFEE